MLKKIGFCFAVLCMLCMGVRAAEGGKRGVIDKIKAAEVVRADGKTIKGSKALSKKKLIGLYFSAHWCPPCRAFTPELVKFHDECVEKGYPFEIVFISCDHSEKDMMGYMSDTNMGWVAIPYSSKLKDELMKTFGVRGIPTLIILDSKGNVISKDARGEVTRDGIKAYKAWKAKL